MEQALNFQVESVSELIRFYQNGNLNHFRASIEVLQKIYQIGNGLGYGEDVGSEGQSPWEAAEEEGFEILGDLEDHKNSAVVKIDEDEFALIGDCNGAWMVRLSDSLLAKLEV